MCKHTWQIKLILILIIETDDESSARLIATLSDALLWNWGLNHREPTVKVSVKSMSPAPIFAVRDLNQHALMLNCLEGSCSPACLENNSS